MKLSLSHVQKLQVFFQYQNETHVLRDVLHVGTRDVGSDAFLEFTFFTQSGTEYKHLDARMGFIQEYIR